MNKENLMRPVKTTLIIISSMLYIGLFWLSVNQHEINSKSVLINDVSRLYPVYVAEIVKHDQVAGLQEVLLAAQNNNLKVSIAGSRHTQGGHTYYEDAVVLDMTEFNEIISLDQENKIITVQSGITWKEIQEYIDPYNLSVKVMQAYNIFTVGGSISVNAHGDTTYGPIVETVMAFRLLLADGTIVNVSRTENAELFSLVIGGYGLFGVILEIDLELTDNEVYEKKTVIMDYQEYLAYYSTNIVGRANVINSFARLSVAPGENYLTELSATTYYKTDQEEGDFDIRSAQAIAKLFFGLARKYDWGKQLRWYLQGQFLESPENNEIVARNTMMSSPSTFLEYYSSRDTDILQEYFIPMENFVAFSDGLKIIVESENINLLSVTIRHVPRNEEAYLSYGREESFAFVLYINQKISEEGIKDAENWTQQLVDLALENNGTYYLAYQLYPSQAQIRLAYPKLDKFFDLKKVYDPNILFMNMFYEHYALTGE